MNKIVKPLSFILIMAAFVLAACGTAATPTVAPVQAISTLPANTLPAIETETQIPSLTPTITMTPTNVTSGNVVTRGNSIFLVTSDLKLIACPLDYCEYEKVISQLTGGTKIVYAFYYSPAGDQNRIATITGNPTKIWFDGIVRTCTTECWKNYTNAKGVQFDVALQALKDSGKTAFATLIETGRKHVDTGLYCMVSGARFGEVFPCANMPTATITPSPTFTITPSPTFTPSFTPSPTNTGVPVNSTPGG